MFWTHSKGLKSLAIVSVQQPSLLTRPAPPLLLGTISSPSAHVVIGNVDVFISSTSSVFGDYSGGGCWPKSRLSRSFPGPLQTDTKIRSRPSSEVKAVKCEAWALSRASVPSYGGSRTLVTEQRGDRARCHSGPSLLHPAPAVVWLFNNSFAYIIYFCIFLK